MVRFRFNVAVPIAGVVAFLGALPLAAARWYLAPILLVPAAVVAWSVRAGVDADSAGLTVRALLGSRRIPWSEVQGFASRGRQVSVVLADGGRVRLPGVSTDGLSRLVEAGGHEVKHADLVADGDSSAATDTARTEPADGDGDGGGTAEESAAKDSEAANGAPSGKRS